MRKKERKLIVTFHTTADAMEMESVCKRQNVPGRLIPVPQEISAGCGLAWCAEPECLEPVLSALERAGIAKEAVCECMI